MRDFKQEEQDYNEIMEMLQKTSRGNPVECGDGITINSHKRIPNVIKKIWFDKDKSAVLMTLNYNYEKYENEPDYGLEKDLDELSGTELKILSQELLKYIR